MNKDEKKMIEEMAKIANFSAFDYKQGKVPSKSIYTAMAEALYNANYRKVADDEIVVKKSEYVVISKQDWENRAYIHAMENHLCQKCRDMIGEKFVAKEEVEYWKSRCKEIGDVASKETAREILQELKNKQIVMLADEVFGRETVITRKINELAKEHGIELE